MRAVKGAGASRAFVKDMLRTWLRNWKRFVSIAVISLLGVAVLTGIYAGCRDMFQGADRFYDDQRLYDIQVVSTLGLTDDDLAALKAVDGVEAAQGERSATGEVDLKDGAKSVTVSEIDVDGLNRPYLQRGRMPRAAGEIAVTQRFMLDAGAKLGDALAVRYDKTGSADDEDDTATDDAVNSADGVADGAKADAMADAAGDDTANTAGDAVDGTAKDITGDDAADAVENAVAEDASDNSSAGGSSDATDADTAGNSDDAVPSFPSDLTIVGVVLDPLDLVNPEGYSAGAFRSSVTSDYTFFAPADGVTGTTYTAISLTVRGAAALDAFKDGYRDAVRAVTDRIEDEVQSDRQQARHQQLVDEAQDAIDKARAEADRQLSDAQSQIDGQRAQFDAQLAQLGADSDAMRDAMLERSPELRQAKEQLDSAQTQLDQQRADTADRFDEEEAKAKASVPKARWYINTRSSTGSFSSLKSDLTSIESIGRAFPVLFLLVAVLMSLTAMTRMVEEERGLIGTYVGLGYGNLTIAMRYLLFALLACLIGGGLGCLVGFLGIPAFLLVVLEGLYVVPGVSLLYDWGYGTAGVLLFVVGVLAATALACRGELRHMPAELMRPKAPKAGARVLLERIRPLWRRMKFLNKVTVRNLFRFKGRLLMTVGGVAGCTALIVCGLAINDTVAALGPGQYGGIYRYDLLAVSADGKLDDLSARLKSDGHAKSQVKARVENSELTNAGGESESVQLVTIPTGGERDFGKLVDLRAVATESAIPFIPDDWELPSFLTKERIVGTAQVGEANIAGEGGEVDNKADDTGAGPDAGRGINADADAGVAAQSGTDSSESGAIVSQSAAKALGIEAGDTVTLTGPDMQRARVKVAAVARSLIGSDVYLGQDAYEQLFDVRFSADGSADVADPDDSTGADDSTDIDASADANENVGSTDSAGPTGATDTAGQTGATDVNDSADASDSDVSSSSGAAGQTSDTTGAASADDSASVSDVSWNAIYATLGGSGADTDAKQAAYAEKLARDPDVLSAVSTADMRDSFQFDLMSAVVALIVALAGSLALVVLFTLANTNVSERVREMATLKVLGFFDREVHRYIHREMLILTLMGIVVGLPLGRWVGGLLTDALNMPGIYFEVRVRWWSYAIAAGATLVFALLVQWLTNPVLDRIDPVSSLKSVE